MTKAAGYTRLSQESDRSIERQKEHIREYAKEKDLELIRIFDEGERVSGFDKNREKYDELIEAARNGEIDAIIVNDRSRLGRDKWQRIQHFSELVQEGVEFHTYYDGFSDPDEEITLLEEAMHAQQDDKVKSEEIEKAKEEISNRIDAGYFHGKPPFGLEYAADKKHLEKNEKEWQVAQFIWNNREDYTLRELRDEIKDTFGTEDDDMKLHITTIDRIDDREREWYEDKLNEYGKQEVEQ